MGTMIEYRSEEQRRMLKNKHERDVFNAVVILYKSHTFEACVERCTRAFGKVSEQRIREIAELATN